MFRSIVALGAAVGTLALISAGSAGAADLQAPPPTAARPAYCGPCRLPASHLRLSSRVVVHVRDQL